jgi:multidrug efflux pump
MTSIAFIAGTLPLVFSTGAGSEMRHAMGIAVFAGMIGVTNFGLFLTPIFYVLLRTLATGGSHQPTLENPGAVETPTEASDPEAAPTDEVAPPESQVSSTHREPTGSF